MAANWIVLMKCVSGCVRPLCSLQIFAVIGMRVASDITVCVVVIQIGKYGMEKVYEKKYIYT